MRNSYHSLIDILTLALETNTFTALHQGTLMRQPLLLETFMEAFPERTDIALSSPGYNWLTLTSSCNIFFESLKIILNNKTYRDALLNAPDTFGLTALECAWEGKNFKAVIELLKYKPKMNAETFAALIGSTYPEITLELKEQLKKQYPQFTEAAVTIQALINTYLEQKHFLTVKTSSQKCERTTTPIFNPPK